MRSKNEDPKPDYRKQGSGEGEAPRETGVNGMERKTKDINIFREGQT